MYRKVTHNYRRYVKRREKIAYKITLKAFTFRWQKEAPAVSRHTSKIKRKYINNECDQQRREICNLH